MKREREYLAKAKRFEERGRTARDPENREWQMIFARAYRMLAEAEVATQERPFLVYPDLWARS